MKDIFPSKLSVAENNRGHGTSFDELRLVYVAYPNIGFGTSTSQPIIWQNYNLDVSADSTADFHCSNHRSEDRINDGSDSIRESKGPHLGQAAGSTSLNRYIPNFPW